MRQDAGYTLSEDELNRAFLRFKSLADKKKHMSTMDLESIVNDEMRDMNNRRFELVGMQVRFVSLSDESLVEGLASRVHGGAQIHHVAAVQRVHPL